MLEKIDALIEELESVCDEFDYVSEADSNWRANCRASVYCDRARQGLEALQEMREHLTERFTAWQLDELHSAYQEG